MCLNKLSLKLEYNKGSREYIGTGYKRIRLAQLPKYGRIGRWKEATGDYNFNPKRKLSRSRSTVYNRDNRVYEYYNNGFHIFLNKIDADKYDNGETYEVQFKYVVAFGTNSTRTSQGQGPCVVTRYMKIVKKVS